MDFDQGASSIPGTVQFINHVFQQAHTLTNPAQDPSPAHSTPAAAAA